MTVSTTAVSVSYAGDGGTTAFPITFQFGTSADLSVVLVNDSTGAETAQSLTTHYTVSQSASGTGTLTMLTAPASGYTLRIRRITAKTQPGSLRNMGSYYPETVEQMFDRNTRQIQEVQEATERSLRFPFGSDADGELATPVAGGVPMVNDAEDGFSWALWGTNPEALASLSMGSGSALVGFLQSGTGAVARTMQDKARDTVSVKDFGAVGDGVTDDLAAFDAALAYVASRGGGRVDVPAGEFRLSGPLVFPDTSGLELVGTSKASAGGLLANGAAKLIADHTDGAAIRISGENNVLRNLLVGASPTRRLGNIDQFGLLVEAADSAGAGARSCLIEGCTFRDHPGHGVVTSGNVYHTRFQSVTIRNCNGHGFVLNEGDMTSRTYTDRPGQISLIDCRSYNVGGHHLRVGSPGGAEGYGAYRIYVENFESSHYETGTYNSDLFDEPANSVFYGENIVVVASAFAGKVDTTPTLSGMYIEGRTARAIANRFISVSPNAVIIGKGTLPCADIVIDGVLVSQDVTLNPAVQVETGVTGVTIFAQNQEQITNVVGGEVNACTVFQASGFVVNSTVTAKKLNIPSASSENAVEVARTDSAVGFRAVRTGTGASEASLRAANGGATVSNGTNSLLIKSNTINISVLPTSSAGLSAGDLWNDSGTLKVAS